MKVLKKWLYNFKNSIVIKNKKNKGENKIFLNYSAQIETPKNFCIALVSPYAKIKGDVYKLYAYLSFAEISENQSNIDIITKDMYVKFKNKWKSWLIDISYPEWEVYLKKELNYIVNKKKF